MERELRKMFEWACGFGCNGERAAIEWYMGKEIYGICPECGEDLKDCRCDGENHIQAEVCFCMN